MNILIIYFCSFIPTLESGVTGEERRLILEEHNYLRQTVATGHVPGQPAAQNMQEMQWDDELAAKAQEWANECTFQHDPSRYLGMYCNIFLKKSPFKFYFPSITTKCACVCVFLCVQKSSKYLFFTFIVNVHSIVN